MNETTQAGGDTARQSIRLALGAVLLVVGGLALMLLDGDNHHSSARMSALTAHSHAGQHK